MPDLPDPIDSPGGPRPGGKSLPRPKWGLCASCYFDEASCHPGYLGGEYGPLTAIKRGAPIPAATTEFRGVALCAACAEEDLVRLHITNNQFGSREAAEAYATGQITPESVPEDELFMLGDVPDSYVGEDGLPRSCIYDHFPAWYVVYGYPVCQDCRSSLFRRAELAWNREQRALRRRRVLDAPPKYKRPGRRYRKGLQEAREQVQVIRTPGRPRSAGRAAGQPGRPRRFGGREAFAKELAAGFAAASNGGTIAVTQEALVAQLDPPTTAHTLIDAINRFGLEWERMVGVWQRAGGLGGRVESATAALLAYVCGSGLRPD